MLGAIDFFVRKPGEKTIAGCLAKPKNADKAALQDAEQNAGKHVQKMVPLE